MTDVRPDGPAAYRVHADDDVAVALRPLTTGERVTIGSISITTTESIGAGHKIALHDMAPNDVVHKYGLPIGAITAPVAAGAWVHSHNLATRLTERERKVLELRFGLGDGYSRTLEEVGKQFKVTRERIRQIEAKALRKMRHPTRIRQLQGFLESEEVE